MIIIKKTYFPFCHLENHLNFQLHPPDHSISMKDFTTISSDLDSFIRVELYKKKSTPKKTENFGLHSIGT
jgi:hypothetical protein